MSDQKFAVPRFFFVIVPSKNRNVNRISNHFLQIIVLSHKISRARVRGEHEKLANLTQAVSAMYESPIFSPRRVWKIFISALEKREIEKKVLGRFRVAFFRVFERLEKLWCCLNTYPWFPCPIDASLAHVFIAITFQGRYPMLFGLPLVKFRLYTLFKVSETFELGRAFSPPLRSSVDRENWRKIQRN